MKGGDMAGVRRIAVVGPPRLGDFLLALPAIEALAGRYPGAELVLVGEPWQAQFLDGRPTVIRRVIVPPFVAGVREPPSGARIDGQTVEAFFERMARERFDLAVQLSGAAREANDFTRRLGARLVVGLTSGGAAGLDRWLPYDPYQNAMLRSLQVVSLVGASPRRLGPSLPLLASDLEEAERRVPPTVQPLAVLNPYARDPRRRWPADKFAEVGDALVQAGAQVVIHGHERERELSSTVLRSMSMPAEHAAGLSLGGLAGLLSRAAVVVSNDSGPLQLAAALGVPSVGIYWCVGALTSKPAPDGPHAWHVSWRVQCILCGRNVMSGACPHRHSLVADVSAEEVTASALRMLEAAGGPRGEACHGRQVTPNPGFAW